MAGPHTICSLTPPSGMRADVPNPIAAVAGTVGVSLTVRAIPPAQ